MSDFYSLDPLRPAEYLSALASEALVHWNIGIGAQLELIKHQNCIRIPSKDLILLVGLSLAPQAV